MATGSSFMGWRLTAVMLLLGAAVTGLAGRLTYIQVIKHAEYARQAEQEHWSKEPIAPQRGTIEDRNGYPLSLSIATYRVYWDTKQGGQGEEARAAARALVPLLGRSEADIMSTISKSGQAKVLLTKGIPYDAGRKIAGMFLKGVSLEVELQRAYPESSMAAALLGFVGKDHQGLAGLEADLQGELAGIPGTLVFERDSIGNPIPLGISKITPSQNGADVILTIDRFIQYLTERELDNALKTQNASGGTIIVMEPSTGAILAMASRPTFDLSQLDLSKQLQMELYRNRAVTDLYEPGSTFKLITMAAALDEGLVTPDTTYYDGGPINKYGWTIDTWNGKHYGTESMTQLLQHSNNVGAVWVSDRLGADKFYKYVARFGFDLPTNVGLSGESPGMVRSSGEPGWSPIDLATNSFGQGLGATPLQMITAVSAIVNNGKLMRPYVVKEVVGENERRTFQPVVVRQVIREETAAKLRTMMNAAAEKGESKAAIVPGYHIGGKTGTASISAQGGYTSKGTIASFVGFAPLDDPKFVILVKIDEPQNSPWGSLVASPVFSSLTRQILAYMQVPPAEPGVLVQKR